MKQLKRLTSVLLVLGIVLGLMPLSAFAAEPENTAEKTFPVTVSVTGGENTYNYTLLNDGTYNYTLLNDGTAELTGFLPGVSVADAVIPSAVKGHPVTSIGESAFVNCTALQSVRFEAPIKSIGTIAFGFCTGLTSIALPEGLETIGQSAFAYCTSLASVTIPQSIQVIKFGAFNYGPGTDKKLQELYYTGTETQWDELMKKKISHWEEGHDYTEEIGKMNPMLTEIDKKNFYCAHTVSFDCGSQAEKFSRVVQYGGFVTPPDDPKADGYRFEGWYTQENGGELFNFNQAITEDVTVYAHWSEVKPDPTVSFDCGGKAEGTSKVVQHGGNVTPPDDPKADGYRFEGWYTQENGGELFNFNQAITEDVTVYAHWSEVKPDPTVSFDCGGKAEGTSKVVQHGGNVTPPDDPKADGYRFEGWYTQENGGELFNFNQAITEDVTVYAHWSEVKPDPTVSFDCGGKAEGTSKVVQHGGNVTPPDDPKADGYRFEGWYTQENGGVPFDFEQEITKDVTVYAHWSVKPTPTPDPKPNPDPNPDPNPNPDAKEYTLTEKDGTLVRVTVEKNGTTVDITKNVVLEQQGTTQIGKIPAGAMVTVAANAAPEGMVFAQWNISDPALMGNPDVAHTSQTMKFPMPAKDVTIEAMYESAENARETELLGSAALIGAVGISAVVLAYQAHQLGTELYLKYLLPSGAALPQNRIQLAELLWRNAGEPVPDGNAMYEDIGLNEEAAQQAAQWAVENELMELPDEEHTEQFKPDEQISYGEAIHAWKKAQQLKTAE